MSNPTFTSVSTPSNIIEPPYEMYTHHTTPVHTVHTVESGEEESTHYHWIGWALFVLALIVIVILLIVWLTRSDEKKELAVSGVSFKLTGSDMLQATWTSTTSTNDMLRLYASAGPLSFNSSGVPISHSDDPIYLVYQTSAVPGTALATPTNPPFKVPLCTRFNAALVVTNSDIKGFRQYNYQFSTICTDTSTTGDSTDTNINGGFGTSSDAPQDGDIIVLSDLSQKGSLRLNMDGDIVYNQKSVSKSSNDVFVHDQGVLCMSSTAKHHRSHCKPPKCGSRSDVLHDDEGKVSLGRKRDLDESSYTWVYNHNGKNRWCLESDTSTCMSFDQGSESVPEETPVNINSSGTTWTNTRIEQ